MTKLNYDELRAMLSPTGRNSGDHTREHRPKKDVIEHERMKRLKRTKTGRRR